MRNNVEFQHSDPKVRAELEEIERHIIVYKKEEAPGYKFIKTIGIGNMFAHILFGKGEYWLCIRKKHEVSLNDLDGYLFSMYNGTLEAVEAFVYERMMPISEKTAKYKQKPGEQIVKGLPTENKEWIYRVKDQHILHIHTGVVFSMAMPKKNITSLFRLTGYNIDCILFSGSIVKNFVLYAPRLDGKSWEQVIGKKIRFATTTEQPDWGYRNKESFVPYKCYMIQRGVATVDVASTKDTSFLGDIQTGHLSHFFSNGGKDLIAGWHLVTK